VINVVVGEDGTAQAKRYVCVDKPPGFDVSLSFDATHVQLASKLFVFHRYFQQLFVRDTVAELSNGATYAGRLKVTVRHTQIRGKLRKCHKIGHLPYPSKVHK